MTDDTKPDHESARRECEKVLKGGKITQPTNVATAYLASQAENARLVAERAERIRLFQRNCDMLGKSEDDVAAGLERVRELEAALAECCDVMETEETCRECNGVSNFTDGVTARHQDDCEFGRARRVLATPGEAPSE